MDKIFQHEQYHKQAKKKKKKQHVHLHTTRKKIFASKIIASQLLFTVAFKCFYVTLHFSSLKVFPSTLTFNYYDFLTENRRGKNNNSTKTTAIVVGGAAAIFFVFIFFLFIKSWGKKGDD